MVYSLPGPAISFHLKNVLARLILSVTREVANAVNIFDRGGRKIIFSVLLTRRTGKVQMG